MEFNSLMFIGGVSHYYLYRQRYENIDEYNRKKIKSWIIRPRTELTEQTAHVHHVNSEYIDVFRDQPYR